MLHASVLLFDAVLIGAMIIKATVTAHVILDSLHQSHNFPISCQAGLSPAADASSFDGRCRLLMRAPVFHNEKIWAFTTARQQIFGIGGEQILNAEWS